MTGYSLKQEKTIIEFFNKRPYSHSIRSVSSGTGISWKLSKLILLNLVMQGTLNKKFNGNFELMPSSFDEWNDNGTRKSYSDAE